MDHRLPCGEGDVGSGDLTSQFFLRPSGGTRVRLSVRAPFFAHSEKGGQSLCSTVPHRPGGRMASAKFGIVLGGENGVGKTSLIGRFALDEFDDEYVATLGAKVSEV